MSGGLHKPKIKEFCKYVKSCLWGERFWDHLRVHTAGRVKHIEAEDTTRPLKGAIEIELAFEQKIEHRQFQLLVSKPYQSASYYAETLFKEIVFYKLAAVQNALYGSFACADRWDGFERLKNYSQIFVGKEETLEKIIARRHEHVLLPERLLKNLWLVHPQTFIRLSDKEADVELYDLLDCVANLDFHNWRTDKDGSMWLGRDLVNFFKPDPTHFFKKQPYRYAFCLTKKAGIKILQKDVSIIINPVVTKENIYNELITKIKFDLAIMGYDCSYGFMRGNIDRLAEPVNWKPFDDNVDKVAGYMLKATKEECR